MQYVTQHRRQACVLVILFLLTLSSTLTGLRLTTNVNAAGTITGTVFRDYNADGVHDGSEPGIQNITVTAYDAAGAAQGTTTSTVDGTYTLNATGTGPYRIEFTGWPGYLQAGAYGSDNATSVQFVPDGISSNVDFGLHNPADYCGNNPRIVTTCFERNDNTGSTAPVVVDFPYNASGTSVTKNIAAEADDIGTTYGLAHQRSTDQLYVSAYVRRGASLGSTDSTGAIYAIQATNPNSVTTFLDLNTIPGIDTGANPHPRGVGGYQWNIDAAAYRQVGKIGLGDLEIADDESALYTINLNERTLVVLPFGPGNTPPNASTITTHIIPIPASCNGNDGNPSNNPDPVADDFRPFGLTYHDGQLYIGAVCSAQSTNQRADMQAYVLEYNPATTSFGSTPLIEFGLDYPRRHVNGGFPDSTRDGEWNPWSDTWRPTGFYDNGTLWAYPQPMLTDIAFDGNGYMTLGFRDRLADQAFQDNDPGPLNGSLYNTRHGGDILLACMNGSGTWQLESNGSCGNRSTGDPNSGSGGNNSDSGPGGREFYYQEQYSLSFSPDYHRETALGSLAILPGSNEVAAVTYDTFSAFEAGITIFNNQDGARNRAVQVYPSNSSFGKAGGLGDVELLCEPAPIEIGNRVWRDDNGNGVQDPGEPGIPGVTVRLYTASGTLISGATAVTDATGHYVFSNDPGRTSTGDSIYNLPLQPATDYVVRVNRATDYDPTGPLAAMVLTSTDSDATPNSDARDNDAAQQSATSMRVDLTTGDHGHNNHTYDIGFVPTMSLGSYIWSDTDNDGAQDLSENGIPGATIALLVDNGSTFIPATDVNGDPVTNQTTGADGLYFFDNLPVGNYRVQVTPPAGYLPSTTQTTADNDDTVDDSNIATEPTPGTYQSGTFTLTPDGEPTETGTFAGDNQDNTLDEDNGNMTIDFGFVPALSLGNRVWHDLDNNGQFNGSESGVGSVAVTLYASDGTTVISTTTTDTDGYYLFQDLAPGDYIVALDATNFTSGQPLDGFVSSTGTPGSPTGPYEGASAPDPDSVATDSDDNGSTNGMLGSGGDIRSAPITLAPGSEPTGEDNGGSDPNDDTHSNLTLDFGVFRPFSLGNRVWEDHNNNGTIDGSESGLSGVAVTLYASDGTTVIATTTTDADGYYRFDHLPAGDYLVDVTLPAGYTSSTNGEEANPNDDAETNDNGVDASVPGHIRSGLITLGTPSSPVEPTGETDLSATGQGAPDAQANMTVDFGIFRLLSLGDLVWEDTNNNGAVDGGESGLDGVTVELYTDTNSNGVYDPGTDTLEDTTTTAGGGLYRFDNLLPGDYLVVLPASNFADSAVLDGYSSSTGGSSEPGPDVDSDADNNDDNGSVTGTLGSGGFIATNAITLAPNSEPTDDGDTDPYTNLSVDMGVFLLAGIGDRVWYDTNLDGIQDPGENGVDGVTVTLYNSSGTAVLTTTTTAGGFYSFTDLQPGEYSVGFSDLPAGHVFTDMDQGGDDADDSDADPTTGRTTTTTLDPGEYEPTWDAGIYQLAGLGNYVWEDLNRDGVQDPGEPPIPEVTVHLYDPADPTTPISTTTTGTAGDYFFGNLVPGDYIVEFVPPTGYELTLEGQGGDGAVDSDADPATGRTTTVTLAPGEVNPDLDAGLFRRASLGDYVWYDANTDGIQDATESGIGGITVRLLDGSGTAILTTTTDTTGFYEFTDLLPGVPYQVEFVSPNGYQLSPNDQGSDDTTDSDANRNTGRTATITLDSSERNPTLDAGLYELASIGDYVWLDADGDGVQDPSETGVISVTVHLYDSNGGLVTTTTTDSTGFYEFPDLEPGNYAVTVVPPAGYQISPNDQGNDDDTDSDADPTTGTMPTTTLEPGENDRTWDAGLYTPVSLGNLVWEDTNNNGVVDTGETGVPGLTVELYRDTNGDGQADPSELVTTTTTDGSGHYQFSDLAPGNYLVALPASTFDSGGPLAGYTSSTGQWGMADGPYEGSATPDPDNDQNNDDNGSTATDGRVVSTPVTLVVGTEPTNDDDTDASSNLSVDFGVFLPASVGSTVWLDEDRDGQKDPAEPGVPDVTVILYDADGNEVARTTTDADGNYQFVNLPPGTYELAFEPPQDYSFTDANTGDDGRDSDADPLTGRTGPITLDPGENDPNWWAGLVALDPAAIVLERFTATWQTDTVVVNWVTSAELDTWGFHLYRSDDETWANATQVTEQLILAQGRGQGGASYQWTDADVIPGTTYTYWLVETELNGTTHRYGPAQTTVTPKTTDYQVFLPLIGR